MRAFILGFSILCLPLFVSASDESAAGGEGPFVGGVFARQAGERYVPASTTGVRAPRTPQKYDELGYLNDLIVLIDVEHPQMVEAISNEERTGSRSKYDTEQAIVNAINSGDDWARTYFDSPEEALFLIQQDRLTPDTRRLLKPDSPLERLHQYLVLRYPSVAAAKSAEERLKFKDAIKGAVVDRTAELSWAPNDPYFPVKLSGPPTFQWGIRSMQFPEAWDKSKGHGYVGVLDGGFANDFAPLPDIGGSAFTNGNYRVQFHVTPFPETPVLSIVHGTHVTGIIAAIGNNGEGTVGACPTCSVSMSRFKSGWAGISAALKSTVERGLQVINYSGGAVVSDGCSAQVVLPMCDAIALAIERDTLVVAAAGNKYNQPTQFPASHPAVLSVGGTQWNLLWQLQPTGWQTWNYDSVEGSSRAGVDGVVAPARAIASTAEEGLGFPVVIPYIRCGDDAGNDESGPPNDNVGSCTGTSMSAPHVSGLAGILRSINPRLTHEQVKDIIRDSSSHTGSPNALRGHGLPNANAAVTQAISLTTNRLTPLFSMYSPQRRDYFYTTVPQMAVAASWGTLQPVNTPGVASQYESTNGGPIQGYGYFPGQYPVGLPSFASQAAVWIFSTPANPKSSTVPLVPLYRMSWKCGDPTPVPPAICASAPNHMDTVYTADPAGLTTLGQWGYKLDGIEGYVYPKTLPQPPGTVRLMRKYNTERDDHAIFPESQLAAMILEGYDDDSGSDWLGYVYPNSGTVPVIQ